MRPQLAAIVAEIIGIISEIDLQQGRASFLLTLVHTFVQS